MMRFTLLIVLLCSSIYAGATQYSKYSWNTFPEKSYPDSIKPVNGSLITLERRINEFYVNAEDVFEEIMVFHRKVIVETHDAINSFNKIYVPLNNVIEVISIKARFVSPSGKVIDVPDESIKEIENLENKGNFRIFAIEGVETGGAIEYYYILRRKFNPYGTVTVQSSDVKVNCETIFAFPNKLAFYIKSYNGFSTFVLSSDTTSGTNYMKAEMGYIPSLTEEKYANYDAALMRYEYTLTHNSYSSALRLYSFSKAANNIYGNLYENSKTDMNAVKKAISNLQLATLSDREKARRLENWLKSEIVVTEELRETPAIEEILNIKQTSKYGMMRLMVAFFTELNLNFETVLTCKQSERKFDPEFNGWNYLDDYLIFFPATNDVILPDNPSYRMGVIPSMYQGAYGLFLRPLSYGKELHTLAYDIKKIPAEDFRKNTDSLFIKVTLNPEEMNIDAEIQRTFTGEMAASFQSFWQLINPERQDEIVSTLFDMGTRNTNIQHYGLKHSDASDIGSFPLKWNVKLTANSLIEQAGDDILFKIGETIGEQAELYQESTRKLPVYVGNLHGYYREIKFEIPQGYTVSNLEDLKMDVQMMHNNKVSSCFKADYELSANTLTIRSTEYYSEMEYPVEEFESFRKVINAAADFNKKSILLIRN